MLEVFKYSKSCCWRCPVYFSEVFYISFQCSPGLLIIVFCSKDALVCDDWLCWLSQFTICASLLLIVVEFGALDVDNWNKDWKLSDIESLLISKVSFWRFKWMNWRSYRYKLFHCNYHNDDDLCFYELFFICSSVKMRILIISKVKIFPYSLSV